MRNLMQHLDARTILGSQKVEDWEELVIVLAVVLICLGADVGRGRFAELQHLNSEVVVR